MYQPINARRYAIHIMVTFDVRNEALVSGALCCMIVICFMLFA